MGQGKDVKAKDQKEYYQSLEAPEGILHAMKPR